MTLRHLKIFLSLYETRSTTATSKELLVAQPTISIALKELEEHYNVKLFDRFSQRLHLTQAGRELYHYAKHIINLFDEAEDFMKSMEVLGNINIGSSITIGNYFLPKYVKKFQERYPYAKIKVTIDNTDNIEKLLLENKIDIGLVEGKIDNSFLQVSPYLTDHLCVICNPKHPYAQYKKIIPEILINETMILREKGSAVRELFDIQMESIGLKIEPLWESISSHAIIQAVKENLGISILPYFIVKEYIERNEISVINIDKLNFSRNFNIIYHKNKFHSTHFDNFIKICLNDNNY